MGLSHSWIAVRGLAPADALGALKAEAGAEVEPEDFSMSFGLGVLPGGWLLVVSDNFDAAFKGRLAPLAQMGPAVACAVEEHVMVSEARGYEGGAEIWRVVRDPEEDEEGLSVVGDPPGFEAIRRAAQQEQEAEGDADFLFDVPADIAASICGFKLGESEPEGFRYTELRPVRTAVTGFFARLFGRRS